MLDLDQLLRHAVEQRASDVHLKVGFAAHASGSTACLRETTFDVVEPEETERVALGDHAAAPGRAVPATGVKPTSCTPRRAAGRFRVSAFRQRGWVGLVMRRVLASPPGFDALGLPPGVKRLADSPSGMVLVTGLAGSGRTSTLASILDHVNQNEPRHIITVEDPIEVLHPDKRSIVTQREVGTDTVSFRDAIVHALRQDPDVVFVEHAPGRADGARRARGRRRRPLRAREHADGQRDRHRRRSSIELFPPHERPQIRGLLARALRGHRVPAAAAAGRWSRPGPGGRGARREQRRVARRSLERQTDRLEAIMREGEYYEMQTFDQSLLKLYRRGLVERDAALHHATSAPALRVELEQVDRTRGTVSPTRRVAAGALGPAGRRPMPPPGGLPVPGGAPLQPPVNAGFAPPTTGPIAAD